MHSGNVDRDLQLPWRLRRTGILEYFREKLMSLDLQELGGARGKLAPALDARQQRLGDVSVAKRAGQQVRGGHGILDREVDANSARRRHGMGGVSNAEQSRPMPLPQPIDLH